MKIILALGGRTKLSQSKEIVERFIKMSNRFLPCSIEYIKNLKNCRELRERFPGAILIGFSPQGEEKRSEEFAELIRDGIREGKKLVFAIGSAKGLSVDSCAKIISLSKMTFSHETARIMVAEQIFRALCLIFGHPYPK